MCGFCGVIGPAERAGVDDVEAMGRTLRHRGPDDSGHWRQGFRTEGRDFEVGFSHTRLSILDLSPAGHQPMSTGDGELTISYNGEIYNFRALRAELEERGVGFRSDCDTEVLLQAYRTWGTDAFDKLNGMFGFAIWDAPRRRLVLARDRMGIKPVYYRWKDGVLSFGSELRALGVHRAFRPEIDRGSLGLLLRHMYVPGPRTIYRDTWRLMPGELLVWQDGEISRETWWQATPEGEAPGPGGDFRSRADELEALLGDAVEKRMIADVPLGAFVSGGVDSSLVVALMRSRARSPVRTFSIGFEDPRWNEAPYARAVAEHLATDHTELTVTTAEARGAARELPVIYDEPFADSSAIPTLLLSRLTREHVTVALSGDGGDELFGGYWQYEKLAKLRPWLRLPGPLRRAAAALAPALPVQSLRNAAGHLRSADAAELASRLVSPVDDAVLADACGEEAGRPNPEYFRAFREARVPDEIQRAMAADARVYLPDDILTKVDRASMSIALEVRVPILDHRVVRLALATPLSLHWHGGRTKSLLREVLYRHVPEALIDRPKHGFGIPIGDLLARELAEWRERFLAPERLREEGHLDPEGVERLLAASRRRGGEDGYVARLWTLLCFQRWFAHHHRGESLD